MEDERNPEQVKVTVIGLILSEKKTFITEIWFACRYQFDKQNGPIIRTPVYETVRSLTFTITVFKRYTHTVRFVGVLLRIQPSQKHTLLLHRLLPYLFSLLL